MRSLLLASVAVLSATAAWAQVVPLGPVFQINTYTTLNQTAASVAADAAGNFVVTWQSQSQDGSGYGIFGRRYDALGVPRSSEFQVNTYTTGDQRRRPAVASDGGGNHTIVWGSNWDPSSPYDYEIMGQRYDASGNRVGGEFQVNTITTGGQFLPSIASDANGNFVVVWQTYGPLGDVPLPNALSGQRYSPTGQPVGAEFRSDSYTTGLQVAPTVAVHDGGRFVVAWQSTASGYHQGHFVRSYDLAGVAGPEFQVNSCFFGYGGSIGPAVASLGAGAFVVAWAEPIAGGSISRAKAQVFDASGFVAGREIAVTDVIGGPSIVSLVADGPDRFTVLWHQRNSGAIWGRSFNTAGVPSSAPFEVGVNNSNSNDGGVKAASQGPGTLVVTWTNLTGGREVFGRLFSGVGSELEQRDLQLDPTGNLVLESGERASLVTGWRNPTAVPIPATGTLSGFTGPEGALYNIVDGDAQYGVIAPGQRADCTTAADCYSLSVRASLRPAQHWDAVVEETLSTGTIRTWPLHIGDSFGDVPRTRPEYAFVEALFHNGVTSGCATGQYCPDRPVTRGEMAVFLRAAREGGDEPNVAAPGLAKPCRPNNCVGSLQVFTDVPVLHSLCPWISELARMGLAAGCGGGNYCPDASVTREQLAVFLLTSREGPGFVPLACVAGAERFDDVPASSGFCPWIEELARRNVVTGCGGDLYCPTAAVTRGDMSVFVTVTFGLPLYGP